MKTNGEISWTDGTISLWHDDFNVWFSGSPDDVRYFETHAEISLDVRTFCCSGFIDDFAITIKTEFFKAPSCIRIRESSGVPGWADNECQKIIPYVCQKQGTFTQFHY